MPPKGRKRTTQAEANPEENGKKEVEVKKASEEPDKTEKKETAKPKEDAAAAAEEKPKGRGWGWGHKKKEDGGDAKGDEKTEKPKEDSAAATDASKEEKPKGRGWGWGKKRKADGEDGEEATKPKLKPKSSISDNFGEIDFTITAKSSDGRSPNFKIASWNVNGIRAWLEKDGLAYIKAEKPDVLCIQETKCDISKIPAEAEVEGYTTHWLSGDTEGYSGVGMYFKNKPLKVTEGIGVPKHDEEGRVLTAEFDKFYLVNTYIPNSGRGLPRLKYRTEEWDVDFRKYLKSLDAKKPVIWCGDLNVAHKEIDIKNPKNNLKTAGFTEEERDSFSATLNEGFIDTFRHLHPKDELVFTFWTYMMNARAKNAGWRLDYFVMSERFKDNLCDSVVRGKVMGSDHCPIVLSLAV